jgi:hypothetical protein
MAIYKILDENLIDISQVLRTTAESATEDAIRNVAVQHLGLIKYYREEIRTDAALKGFGWGEPELNSVVAFCRRAGTQAVRGRWRSVLNDTRALIMALPGDPPSEPKVPPKRPW